MGDFVGASHIPGINSKDVPKMMTLINLILIQKRDLLKLNQLHQSLCLSIVTIL